MTPSAPSAVPEAARAGARRRRSAAAARLRCPAYCVAPTRSSTPRRARRAPPTAPRSRRSIPGRPLARTSARRREASIRARRTASRSASCSRELRDDVLANGVNVADPRCAAHLQRPTLLSRRRRRAGDRRDEPVAGLLRPGAGSDARRGPPRALAGGDARPRGRVRRADERRQRIEPARPAARARARLRSRAAPGHGRRASAQHARWRILASSAAHDSVRRAAAVLGLGAGSVVGVATDDRGRIDVAALDAALAALAAAELEPIAIVATAGTTDLGAIDPLAALAERAARLRRLAARRRRGRLGVRAVAAAGPAAGRHRAGRLDHGRPAQALVHADRGQRAARARRRPARRGAPPQRLPQPRRRRGRRRAQPRRTLARHVAPLRRAEDPRRAARHRTPPARGDGRAARRARPLRRRRRRRARRARAARRAVDGDGRLSLAPGRRADRRATCSTPSTSPRSARCCARAAR